MNTEIVVALLSGLVSIVVTIITVLSSSNKTRQAIQVQMALHDERIKNLANEVKAHNEYGRKIPAIEVQLANITNRLDNLERR